MNEKTFKDGLFTLRYVQKFMVKVKQIALNKPQLEQEPK